MTPIKEIISFQPNLFPPKPDFSQIAVIDKVEDTAVPVLFETPPRKTSQPFVCSPSILPSPNGPTPPHPYHYAEDLLEAPGILRDARKLKGKDTHSIALTDSAKKQAHLLADPNVAKEVSKRVKHKLRYPSQNIPPYEPVPGTLIDIEQSDDSVVVQDVGTKRRRIFGYHQGAHGKCIYPKDGDGVIQASKGSALSPNDFLEIAKRYRKVPTGMPAAFLADEVKKMVRAVKAVINQSHKQVTNCASEATANHLF